jgi:uncharacterized protein (DUF1810 family)
VTEGLERFRAAQAPVIGAVMAELARGRKETHWMWFVFPQLRGLGRSERARFYGLDGRAEARAYAADAVLGPRLRAGCELMLSHAGRAPEEVLGAVDATKLRSCATLFAECTEAAAFPAVLAAFYGGERCAATREALGA